MVSIIIILVFAAMSFCVLLVLALARVAARADERDEEVLARRLHRRGGAHNENYAGLAPGHSAISPEPSMTVPSTSFTS